MNNKYISVPLSQEIELAQRTKTEQDNDSSFGYYVTIGEKQKQEDALTWRALSEKELIPQDSNKQLTPQDIAYRLWTVYQQMEKSIMFLGESGTTASSTVFDGKGNLITATLGDAVSFAVVYDKDGNALNVARLNSITHSPEDVSEQLRIAEWGNKCLKNQKYEVYQVKGRTGLLNVSRAIGDINFRGVTADASIDITDMDTILRNLKIKLADVGSVQIITTSDGFTDGVGYYNSSKADQEEYLLAKLNGMETPGKLSEAKLAQQLAEAAKAEVNVALPPKAPIFKIIDGKEEEIFPLIRNKKDAAPNRSRDNIAIAIQTLSVENLCNATPFFIGVYDGHNGADIATHVAQTIVQEFIKQCGLTAKAYAEQQGSVIKRKDVYEQDNKKIEIMNINEEKKPGETSSTLETFGSFGGGVTLDLSNNSNNNTHTNINEEKKPGETSSTLETFGFFGGGVTLDPRNNPDNNNTHISTI